MTYKLRLCKLKLENTYEVIIMVDYKNKMQLLEWIVWEQKYGEDPSNTIIIFAYNYLTERGLIKPNPDLDNYLPSQSDLDIRKSDVYFEVIKIFDEIGLDGIRQYVYEVLSGNASEFRPFVENSSDRLCELAINLLDIKDDQYVIDFGSGMGNFLANVYKDSKKKNYKLTNLVGIELNEEQAVISKMALSILNDGDLNFKIYNRNALERNDYPYTRAYTFPPLGMRTNINESTRRSFAFPDIYFTNKNTIEWLFIDAMLSGKKLERAVALVTGKALFNDEDIKYRNRLIKEGWIEGIIELPAGSLRFSSIKIFVIVFSRGNDKVKFVDASNVLGVENKRYANINLPVEEIIDMYNQEDVVTKPIASLNFTYNLMPSVMLLNVKKVANGVLLGDVAEVITGSQYTYGVFEKRNMLSNENTGYQILTSSDIDDSTVNWKQLQSIKYNGNKFDKYAVQYGDIVVTSKSSKVKTVFVDLHPNHKIFVTGGMLIVRANGNKIHPLYLKMFFDSEMGQIALKSIQKGSYVVTISAKGLKSIQIPLIDFKKQMDLAHRYKKILTTLTVYKSEVARLEDKLKNMLVLSEEE